MLLYYLRILNFSCWLPSFLIWWLLLLLLLHHHCLLQHTEKYLIIGPTTVSSSASILLVFVWRIYTAIHKLYSTKLESLYYTISMFIFFERDNTVLLQNISQVLWLDRSPVFVTFCWYHHIMSKFDFLLVRLIICYSNLWQFRKI